MNSLKKKNHSRFWHLLQIKHPSHNFVYLSYNMACYEIYYVTHCPMKRFWSNIIKSIHIKYVEGKNGNTMKDIKTLITQF